MVNTILMAAAALMAVAFLLAMLRFARSTA
jgi:hypothetical protein